QAGPAPHRAQWIAAAFRPVTCRVVHYAPTRPGRHRRRAGPPTPTGPPMRRLATPVAARVPSLALAACRLLRTEPPPPPTVAPPGANGGTASQQLNKRSVRAGLSMSGYSRDLFHVWASQGGGCDTRDVVLKQQGTDIQVTTDCKITSGSWTSPYNGKAYTNPRQ